MKLSTRLLLSHITKWPTYLLPTPSSKHHVQRAHKSSHSRLHQAPKNPTQQQYHCNKVVAGAGSVVAVSMSSSHLFPYTPTKTSCRKTPDSQLTVPFVPPPPSPPPHVSSHPPTHPRHRTKNLPPALPAFHRDTHPTLLPPPPPMTSSTS
ncbi:hypothetical protein BDD12DRAFT_85395 [Trichophaea hybrida]|nr:hypothetical protein BDD12DRAFT_85395 [Trichophaea hybrida]